MPSPDAGDLNRRIVIEALTQTKDAQGGMVDAWSTDYTLWAQVRNLPAKPQSEHMLTAHGGQVSDPRTEFTVRYNAGITAKHRISYAGKKYNIRHVNDYNAGHHFMILTCDTGLNDGR